MGKVCAVKDISFNLNYAESFALLWISGAGKTTCFKCLTSEIYPDSGAIRIFGNDITTFAGFQQARKNNRILSTVWCDIWRAYSQRASWNLCFF